MEFCRDGKAIIITVMFPAPHPPPPYRHSSNLTLSSLSFSPFLRWERETVEIQLLSAISGGIIIICLN